MSLFSLSSLAECYFKNGKWEYLRMTKIMNFMKLGVISALFSVMDFVVVAQDIIKSHGISTFGDLKYERDFKNLSYVNVKAPK